MAKGGDDRQLDLFAAPPLPLVGVVLPFPVQRWAPAIWRGKVERTASVLVRKPTEKAKTRYWEDTAATLAEQLRRRGANEIEIREQLWQFFFAVESALNKEQERRSGMKLNTRRVERFLRALDAERDVGGGDGWMKGTPAGIGIGTAMAAVNAGLAEVREDGIRSLYRITPSGQAAIRTN